MRTSFIFSHSFCASLRPASLPVIMLLLSRDGSRAYSPYAAVPSCGLPMCPPPPQTGKISTFSTVGIGSVDVNDILACLSHDPSLLTQLWAYSTSTADRRGINKMLGYEPYL